MYHVYEQAGAGRLAVLSDDDWGQLSDRQRSAYRLRAGELRTALEAVVRLVELDRTRTSRVASRTGMAARVA